MTIRTNHYVIRILAVLFPSGYSDPNLAETAAQYHWNPENPIAETIDDLSVEGGPVSILDDRIGLQFHAIETISRPGFVNDINEFGTEFATCQFDEVEAIAKAKFEQQWTGAGDRPLRPFHVEFLTVWSTTVHHYHTDFGKEVDVEHEFVGELDSEKLARCIVPTKKQDDKPNVHHIRQAKPSEKEILALDSFCQKLEEKLDDYYPTEAEDILDWLIVEFKKVSGSYSRVIWACDTLIKTCCDPELSYLDWRPDLKSLIESAD